MGPAPTPERPPLTAVGREQISGGAGTPGLKGSAYVKSSHVDVAGRPASWKIADCPRLSRLPVLITAILLATLSSTTLFEYPRKLTGRIDTFISRWQAADGKEIANTQPFLTELCDLLGVEAPPPRLAEPQGEQLRLRANRHLPQWRRNREPRPHRPLQTRLFRARVQEPAADAGVAGLEGPHASRPRASLAIRSGAAARRRPAAVYSSARCRAKRDRSPLRVLTHGRRLRTLP